MEKQLISSHSGPGAFYLDHLLAIHLFIMLVHTLFLYTTREILVRDMLGSGVISND